MIIYYLRVDDIDGTIVIYLKLCATVENSVLKNQ